MKTTRELARFLGCTVQAVNKARRKAEDEAGRPLGEADPADKRVTIFSEAETELILKFAPQRKDVSETDSEIDEAELLEDESPPGLMVLQSSPIAQLPGLMVAKAPEVLADGSAITQEINAITTVNQRNISELSRFMNNYTTAKVQGAVREVDHVVEAIKANALNQAICSLGKSAESDSASSTSSERLQSV